VDNQFMSIKNLPKITYLSFLIPLTLGLTSCGSSSEPKAQTQTQTQAQVDVCKEVMSSMGRYADIGLKFIDEPEKAIPEYSKLSSELSSIAASLPAGPQRDYVKLLSDDFKKMTDADAGLEAALAIAADVRLEKIKVVCPIP
jgi:hypothetical protein